MYSLLLLWLLSTTFYYLGARAAITRFLWDRYPPHLASFMDCPACSGFWYGLILGSSFVFAGRDLPLDLTTDPLSIFVCGLMSIVLTPIGAAILTYAFELNGSAVAVAAQAPELLPSNPNESDVH